jgi:hypothetical protein
MRHQVYERFFQTVATSCSSSLLWMGKLETGLLKPEGVYMEEFPDLGLVNAEKTKQKSTPFS